MKNFLSKFTKKQIIIACLAFVIFSVVMGLLFGKPQIKEIIINDININKGDTAELNVSVQPEKADVTSVKCNVVDENVATISGTTVTGIEEGKTEIICKSSSVEAKLKLNVKLTEEQAKEKADKIAKEKAENEEKIANELETYRNTVTSDDRYNLISYSKEIVDNSLKSPSSAKYAKDSEWAITKIDNVATIMSYVDADNAFGANIRNDILIQVKMDDEGTGKAIFYQLGGQIYLDETK